MTEKDQSIEEKYANVLKEIANKLQDEEKRPPSYGYGVRHLQAIIIFVALSVTYIARSQLSATIVAMTDELKLTNFSIHEDNENATTVDFLLQELNNATDETVTEVFDYINDTNANVIIDELQVDVNKIGCDDDKTNKSDCQVLLSNVSQQEAENDLNNVTSTDWNVYRVYSWPKSTQEMVLSSFFVGYAIMMSPMGLVCQRWGGKLPLQISLFSTAVVTFLTPWLAVLGDYKAVCLTRVTVGLTQAGTYPGLHNLVSKWIPASERGRLATYVYTGSMVGTVVAYHMSGFLSVSRFGWPSVFWLTGILCLVMGLLVTWIVTPSPQQNRFISEEEKHFILGGVEDQTEKRYKTPWKAIMTSKPVWACFFAHIGSSTNFLFLFSQIPSYLHHAVGLNIKDSGLLSSLPYLANFFLSILIGIGSDYLTNKKIMSLKLVRIISNWIANIGPAIAFIALSFITNPALAVGCLVFCMATHAGSHTGWMLSYIDLSPNFSGTLMATGNTLMNISALLLPVLVSNIVTDMTNIYQWRIVLVIVAVTGLLCNIVYVSFISADVQPWNEAEYQTTELKDPDDIKEKPDQIKQNQEN